MLINEDPNITALRERVRVAEAHLAAVEQTLRNVGATGEDENGYKLNANGMLVDWLAGRRNPLWTGTEGTEVDRLRAVEAAAKTLLETSPAEDSDEGRALMRALGMTPAPGQPATPPAAEHKPFDAAGSVRVFLSARTSDGRSVVITEDHRAQGYQRRFRLFLDGRCYEGRDASRLRDGGSTYFVTDVGAFRWDFHTRQATLAGEPLLDSDR
jgi:hypothetical protein